MNHSSLIYIPKKNPSAKLRLICFSYAGGNPATYISWIPFLPDFIELAVIQLPGRGMRIFDEPYQTMAAMVNDIFVAIGKLDAKPFILYGHSMGARVAYEVTLMLWRFQYRLPIHFIASGSGAPCVVYPKDHIHHLPDDELIIKVGELNGSSEEVLANKEIMQLVLPAMRADFRIIETYCNNSALVIPTKISVFAGTEDDIAASSIEKWLDLFITNTGIHWIQGDHYFVDKNRADLLTALNNLLLNEVTT